jgi:guanosine-3',5'-bis(diphosphate) 3'-pyrophosphohydrolase
VLEAAVAGARQNQRELVANVETAVRGRLEQEALDGEVSGREKHLFSIYRKMREKAKPFRELVDVFAFRVIVDRVDTCYRVLGQVHNLYKPVPGKFKDYIAIPKANGYQSLHTVLFGPNGTPIEVQIRTRDMHRIADAGIAAHWLYKNAVEGAGATALAEDWLQNLLEMQRDSGDSQEFLEHVKIDLFPDEVYVFTPKGRILVLPKGATVVDFAYAIHSDVGNTCVAARIDRRLAPLRTVLYSGQTVEIITAPGANPNASWLNFVVTGKARATVRGYLKNLKAQEAEALGRRMLNAELARFGLDVDAVGESVIAVYAREVNLETPARCSPRSASATGCRCWWRGASPAPTSPSVTRNRWRGQPAAARHPRHRGHGREPCPLLPADPGRRDHRVVQPGKGIVVHRCECRNLGEFQSKRDKWLEVEWDDNPKAEFATEIRVEVGNRRGALATIAAAIAEQGSNIEHVNSREKDGMTNDAGLHHQRQSRSTSRPSCAGCGRSR